MTSSAAPRIEAGLSLEEFQKLTEPEQARAQMAQFQRYARDPWPFLSECVFTLDQVDVHNPIKPFPVHLDYLRAFTYAWLKHMKIAVPKSRRMTMSWTCIALYLWDTMFKPGRFNGFVSKKEDDAGDLVSRAEFIFQHIPEFRIPKALLPKIKNGKMSKAPPILEFEELHSKIQGFPMGADQLRQYTMSGLLGDECAFWPEAQKFLSSATPTLEGGGRVTLISSRSPGYFKKVVFDQLDAQDLSFPETPAGPVKKPLEGVEVWQNPKNGFFIMDVNYTANPAKRSAAWVKAVKNSMPIRDFLMEYEKSWHTYEGLPVYGDFDRSYHVSQSALDPERGLPLLLGWDFGLTPACVVTQLVEGQLRILKEIIGKNESAKTFAPRVWSELRVNFAPWTHLEDMLFSFVDPSGFYRSDTDASTCIHQLTAAGFRNVRPGPSNNDFEMRKQSVESFLLKRTRRGPGLLVDPKECPTIIDGFTGGYQYSEHAADIEPSKLRPLKNRYSHPHDGLQYVCFGAIGKLKSYNIISQPPEYGFLKRAQGESNGRI